MSERQTFTANDNLTEYVAVTLPNGVYLTIEYERVTWRTEPRLVIGISDISDLPPVEVVTADGNTTDLWDVSHT